MVPARSSSSAADARPDEISDFRFQSKFREESSRCQRFNRQREFRFHPALKRYLHTLIALITGFHLLGGPYALVQACAWANMLVDYSKEDGLLKAAADTFGGEKPCDMCCKIREAKKEAPSKPAFTPSEKTRHEALPMETVCVEPPAGTSCLPVSLLPPVSQPGIGQDAPVPPPPRLA